MTVLVHTHTRGSCFNAMEVRTLSWMDDKPIWWCSVHPSRSQIPTVMAMSITMDSLLPRPKLDCDAGYDAAVKGTSVVVSCLKFRTSFRRLTTLEMGKKHK